MEYLALVGVLIVGLVVGVFVGIIIGVGRMKRAIEESSVGHLRIDRSEPDEPPKAFLELQGVSIGMVAQKKVVMLKVVNENYLSRD